MATVIGDRKRIWLFGVIFTLAVYFPTALLLRSSYDPPPRDAVFRLAGFTQLSHKRFGYMSQTQKLKDLADTEDGPPTSPVLLFEDGKPLGPAHTSQTDVEYIGLGRFLHLKRVGFFFSASDNSDPKTIGRTYWVVLPESFGQLTGSQQR
jgi:hypothetical protein